MFEEIYTLLTQLPAALFLAVFVGLLRNVTGFFQVYLTADSVKYDWKLLVNTVTKYFIGVFLLSLVAVGVQSGFDIAIPIEGILGSVVGLDVVSSYYEKQKALKTVKK